MDRRVWKQQEDHHLRQLVLHHGTKNWTELAAALKQILPNFTRNGKQCRERWANHLKEGIKGGHWENEQVECFLELRQRLGNRWTLISKEMPQRSENTIKNYYYSNLRRAVRHLNKVLKERQLREMQESFINDTGSSESKISMLFIRKLIKMGINKDFSADSVQEVIKIYNMLDDSKKEEPLPKRTRKSIQPTEFQESHVIKVDKVEELNEQSKILTNSYRRVSSMNLKDNPSNLSVKISQANQSFDKMQTSDIKFQTVQGFSPGMLMDMSMRMMTELPSLMQNEF